MATNKKVPADSRKTSHYDSFNPYAPDATEVENRKGSNTTGMHSRTSFQDSMKKPAELAKQITAPVALETKSLTKS